MKTLKIPALICALLLMTTLAWGAGVPAGLEFKPLDQALAAAKKDGRPVMMYFWAEWCPYCTLFNEQVLTDPGVAETLKKFQAVSVDVDDDPQQLAKKYKAVGLPTVIFLDSRGETILTLPGALPPEIFLGVLSYIESGAYAETDIESYLDQYFKESAE